MIKKEEYYKVLDTYTKINKKVLIGFGIIAAFSIVLCIFYRNLVYPIGISIVLCSYLVYLFCMQNIAQIRVSFNEYYLELLSKLAIEYKITIPSQFQQQLNNDELSELFGTLMDNQYQIGKELLYTYKGLNTVISTVTVRNYDEQMPKTLFNGNIIKVQYDSEISDFLYVNENRIIDYNSKYTIYDQVNLVKHNSLYVTDDKNYNDIVKFVSRLEHLFGEELIVFVKDDTLYIAIELKIKIVDQPLYNLKAFDEGEIEKLILSYIELSCNIEIPK